MNQEISYPSVRKMKGSGFTRSRRAQILNRLTDDYKPDPIAEKISNKNEKILTKAIARATKHNFKPIDTTTLLKKSKKNDTQ